MFFIQINDPYVQVGNTVQGTVEWRSSGTVPRAIIIAAAWRTEGRGDVSLGKAGELRVPYDPSRPLSGVPIPFAFDIPAEGPVSYDGKMLRIIWEIVAQADLPMMADEKSALAFRVAVRMP
ncbi:hypothetical protein F8S13_25860 [Chloroflexia bacterium SDU3-3]|nr:hypothetical protein F8S13_25860 [Chloroflexia bacterium SDU3-3]